MPGRPLYRATLEAGLKLDINHLTRRGFIRPGALTGPAGIEWRNAYWDVTTARGVIHADMRGSSEGWFRITRTNGRDQTFRLVARPRHFGGRQWFFMCPFLNRRAMVLWQPPGASVFASREKWGRQVAYQSQFFDRTSRAHRGKAKIRKKLCALGGFDEEEWDMPPKPKWMRTETYDRLAAKFDEYDSILDEGIAGLVARLKL